jgi:hypothetical protein
MWLYTVNLYKTKQQHCKSLIHINNIKYCDEQNIFIFNSHIGNHITHNEMNEEV